MSRATRTNRNPDRGFSLVEMMVAITIALIVTGAVTLIFIGNKQSYTMQNQGARLQEAGRFAVEALVRDLREAGSLGGYDLAAGSVEGAVAPGACDAANWGLMVNQRIYGLNDTNNDGTAAGNYTNANCIPNSRYYGGDVLIVRRIMPVELAAADLVANGIYLKTDLGRAQLFTGTTAPTKDFGTPAFMYPVVTRAYYLDRGDKADKPCPDSGASKSVLSLYRLSATTTGGLTREQVIRGVEEFQVQYGIDDNADGTVNRFIDADGATFAAVDTNGIATWQKIIAVRLWLLLRAACLETGYTNDNEYNLGSKTFKAPSSEDKAGYRRQLFTATVMLRNPPAGAL
jgi:type IV pilus assembly protein PilW